MHPKLNSQSRGVTFIEFIIYIAVTAIALVSIVRFGWATLGASVKVEVSLELTQNGRLVIERMTEQVRHANDLNQGSSTFSVHPGILSLGNTAGAVTVDTYTKSVDVGGQMITIRKLRMKEGTASALDLTSDRIDVTNFVIRDRTRTGELETAQIELTMDFVDSGQDPLRSRSLSLQTTTAIRQP